MAHRRFEWKKNQKTVDYFTQQNTIPDFREFWTDYQSLNLSSFDVTVFTQSQATENAVKQLQAPKIIHIATHGFFLPNLPRV